MTLTSDSKDNLFTHEQVLAARYAELQNKGLKLDLTRGKPSPEQLTLADSLDGSLNSDYISPDGTDVRNY